jgi:hypothetical protein
MRARETSLSRPWGTPPYVGVGVTGELYRLAQDLELLFPGGIALGNPLLDGDQPQPRHVGLVLRWWGVLADDNPSCYLFLGLNEKIEAAMLSRTIAAFCIIDDALQAMGHKDDPQTKVPSSVILTLAILAAMELGGKHNKALALAKDLNLFTHVPSPSRFNRRLHALYPLFLPLLHLLSQVWKSLHQAQAYALDTFPLPACENIRAPRCRLFPDRAYRGFIPSKRVYFHGPKLHLLVDDGKFIHEVNLTPGSLHDLTSLLLLPLDLPEGVELYLDRGYESYLYEDLLREAQGIVPMVIRRGNSRRYVPWLQYLAIVGRRVVETVGGMLHAMFPRRIHAVTQEGFVIKVLSFVLAHKVVSRCMCKRLCTGGIPLLKHLL